MTCKLWHLTPNKDGYGEKWVGGVKWMAHRWVWMQANGQIPNGMVIRHKCDVRNCVNLDHLELGSVNDNVQDRVKRHRGARGETQGRSRFTEEHIHMMRALHKRGWTQIRIARIFQTHQGTVQAIVTRKTWSHI